MRVCARAPVDGMFLGGGGRVQVRHLIWFANGEISAASPQLETPLEIVVDGLSRCGVVMKPGKPFDVYVGQVKPIDDARPRLFFMMRPRMTQPLLRPHFTPDWANSVGAGGCVHGVERGR